MYIDYTSMEIEKIKIQQAKPKLLILGHAGHGKDTVSEILRDEYGFRFIPSSMAAAEYISKNFLQDQNYSSPRECYEDRDNHRPTWYKAIAHYNSVNPTSWAERLLKEGDIYCGMRRLAEFEACIEKKLFDHVIWVDALKRLDPEPKTSFTIPMFVADYIIDNNGSEADLRKNIRRIMQRIKIV